MSENQTPNKLIDEISPYLLQHAHNPVHWFPWGDEAFQIAKTEKKPVFLSIGYSTCHWCHVMERESFEDQEVAALLNRHFVSIKVDREERPDVDHVYMSACLAMTGSGGWPLTVFLTPDRKPFFAGTYFPKQDSYGRMGLIRLLKRIVQLWEEQPESLSQTAEELTRGIREDEGETGGLKISGKEFSHTPGQAVARLLSSLDKKWGGFGHAPKFPTPHNLMFLMRMAKSEPVDSPRWLAVRKTLDGMAAGGIRDHIGGGFCRYSTDERWLVPHFEKMLYDNALLIMAYTECWLKTSDVHCREVVTETADFVLREMTSPDGGFYTAFDADSEGEEGLFYLWTPEEIERVLGQTEGRRYCSLYGITHAGNFEGRSIPNLLGGELGDNLSFAQQSNRLLAEERKKRIPPFLDTKIMLSNNGLMIAALCKAASAFDKPDWLRAAKQAMVFLLNNLIHSHSAASIWKDGQTRGNATLDGVAFAVWGLIELYEISFDPRWLGDAVRLNRLMLRQYSEDNGGLYFSTTQQSDLPLRGINAQDSAVPSGQSVAAHNLIRLARLTGNPELETRAKALIDNLAPSAYAAPTGYTWLLAALDYLQDGGADLVLSDGEGLRDLLAQTRGFYPYTTVTVTGKDYPGLEDIASFTKHMTAQDGKAAAYLCRGGSCTSPVTESGTLKALLSQKTSGSSQ